MWLVENINCKILPFLEVVILVFLYRKCSFNISLTSARKVVSQKTVCSTLTFKDFKDTRNCLNIYGGIIESKSSNMSSCYGRVPHDLVMKALSISHMNKITPRVSFAQCIIMGLLMLFCGGCKNWASYRLVSCRCVDSQHLWRYCQVPWCQWRCAISWAKTFTILVMMGVLNCTAHVRPDIKGDVLGRGRAWRRGRAWQGMRAWQGGMRGRGGGVWQRDVHGRGACVAGGACVVEACEIRWYGQIAGGTHRTEMHSCWNL